MGLDTWVAVVLFLILIAPGLLFDLLTEKRHVRGTESTLRETGRVALASLVFSTVSSVIVLSVGQGRDSWLPTWSELFADPHAYFVDHYKQVVATLLAEVVLALGLVCVVHWFLAQRSGGATLQQTSPWTQVFKDERLDGRTTQVCVTLVDGKRILGTVAKYSADLSPTEERELVLAWPISVWSEAEMKFKPSHVDWQRTIIPGTQIARIDVAYRLETEPPE